MERSLLSVLKEEDKLVREIDICNDMISRLERSYEVISGIPVECESKSRELNANRALIKEYKADVEAYKIQLDDVRYNLKRYLNEILK